MPTKLPLIDILLPGLNRGAGRNKDRFRVSSGTGDKKVRTARIAIIKRIAERAAIAPEHWVVLRAMLDDRFTIRELHEAYDADPRNFSGLGRLLEVASKPDTLADLFEKYLAQYRRKGRSKQTQQITACLEFLGSGATVADFTPARISAFLDQIDVAGSTKDRYRAAISGFATWLLQKGHIQRHPIAFRSVKKYGEQAHRLPRLRPEEVDAYFAAIRGRPLDHQLVLRVAITTGADVGELLPTRDNGGECLRVRDVFLDGERRLQLKRHKVKASPERFVPMPDDVANDLRAWIAQQGLGLGDRVFAGVDYYALFRTHRVGREAIKQSALTVKDFRHIAAINWRKAGKDLEWVREKLGHSTIEQTRIYAAHVPDKEEEVAAADGAYRILTGGQVMRLIA